MKKVAIYSRKSVLVEGSVSIETQINMCKDYINNKFHNAKFRVFEDEGFSGGNTNRPAFQKMLRMAQLNEIDIVVCYKVDRIARNTLDFLKILELFKENNVELISISEGFDPNTQMGKVMLTLLASFAEMERTNIQQRVKDNLLSIAKKGKWTGGSPPTGFKNGLNGGLEWNKQDMILDVFNMKYEKEKNSNIIKYIKEKYNIDVYLEPGEAIALNAGYLVSTVLDTMKNGMDIAIVDTSAECHMPDVLEMPYRPKIIGAGNPCEFKYTYRLGGPTCLAGDIIGDYSFEEELRAGDKLVFCDMAHYSMVKNNTFNGINLPDIVLLNDDGFKVIREFNYNDFKSRL